MSNKPTPPSDQVKTVIYQVRINGHLDHQWTHWFEGLTITLEEDGNTLLSGPVADQAALHGLLKKVRDLGMPLVSVVQTQPNKTHSFCSKKEKEMNTNRKIAIIVGVLYIIGTVAGVLSVFVTAIRPEAPDFLNAVASNANQVAMRALLVLVMGLPLAMVPAMMFPILKRQNEALAIGYVIFRGALESFTYIATALCWLLLVVVARQYADSDVAVASQFSNIGILLIKARDPILAIQDIVFSLGALMFYYLLYQPRLIPRWLSGWGLIGAILYGAVGLIYMFTGDTLVTLLMPLALQEMVLAIWLIAKGFNPSAIAAVSANAEMN